MSTFASDHAIERAASRYGLRPTEADWGQVILDITDGRTLLLRRRWSPDGGREIHRVHLCGVEVVVLYVPDIARVITVLPLRFRLTRADVEQTKCRRQYEHRARQWEQPA